MTTDRVPPHNLEAEQSFLGCILMRSLPEMFESLDPGDFYRPAHSRIFAACCDLFSAGTEIDHLTVVDKLKTLGTLESSGGAPYILDLSGIVPTTANWRRYKEIILRTSKLRQLIGVGTQIVASAYENGDDASGLASEALGWLIPLQETGLAESGKLIDLVRNRAKEYAKPSAYFIAPASSVKLHFGDFTIIAARPGSGKSAYVAQCADVWSQRYKTAFYTFEMSAEELSDRWISRQTRLPSDWRYDGATEGEVSILLKHIEPLSNRDLTIIEASGMTEAELAASLRVFAAQGGKIAIVDYLQIAYMPTKSGENADITRFSKRLRQIAKSCNLAVIGVSQFSRAGDGDEQNKIVYPRAKHLRGSGSLEQDAANICLMYTYPPAKSDLGKSAREQLNLAADLYDPKTELVRLHWDKVRHGKREIDYALFCGDAMEFTEIEEIP